MPRAILRTPFLPIMNLLSSNSYLRPLKLLVDMFSKARTYKYLYLFMKVWTLSTMYSLCYLSLGLVLVKETSLFLLASGINNYKFDYINSKSHYKNLRSIKQHIRSINKNEKLWNIFCIDDHTKFSIYGTQWCSRQRASFLSLVFLKTLWSNDLYLCEMSMMLLEAT